MIGVVTNHKPQSRALVTTSTQTNASGYNYSGNLKWAKARISAIFSNPSAKSISNLGL